jgi:hypothetical protein
MKAAILTITNRKDEKSIKNFIKQTGIRARILKQNDMEDSVFGGLITKGMKSGIVKEESVMKVLYKK